MRALVLFHITDLRLLDHPALHHAHSKHKQVIHLLCIPKLGSLSLHRSRFLYQSISALRSSLISRQSNLIIVDGDESTTLPQILKQLQIDAVYSAQTVAFNEAQQTAKLKASLNGKIEYNEYWQNTLYDLDQLPQGIANLPDQYTEFRKKVERLSPRNHLPIPKIMQWPSDVDTSNFISTIFEDLQYQTEGATFPQLFTGGESEAWARVKLWIWEQDLLKSYKLTRNGLDGLEFSSKLSPWLSHGCISPKSIANEIQKYERERVKNDSTYWLMFELLWRDYFTYYALRYQLALFLPGGPKNLPAPSWLTNSAHLTAW